MFTLHHAKGLVGFLLVALAISACGGGDDGRGGSGGAGGADGGSGGGQGGSTVAPPEDVECTACFPFEALPAELQPEAEKLLLEALDNEALYSILGDLKPMSSGFAAAEFPAADTSSPEVDRLRTILGAFHCTDRLTGAVQVFAQAFDGKKQVEALVFHRPRFAETITQYPDPFVALGVDAGMDPLAAVDIVDADPTTKRFRAYGYLFGYPKHAVDFFVAAEESEAMTGTFVERDFVHIPTYSSPTNRFTYAVPKGHMKNDDDVALAERAAPVLAAYKKVRAEFVGAGKPGVIALVRAVMGDGDGRCSPANAAAYIAAHGDEPAPACGEAGEGCVKSADCCSNDCHNGHCH